MLELITCLLVENAMGMGLYRYRPARAQAALQNNDAMLAICDGAANEEEKPHEVPEDKRCSDAAGGAAAIWMNCWSLFVLALTSVR